MPDERSFQVRSGTGELSLEALRRPALVDRSVRSSEMAGKGYGLSRSTANAVKLTIKAVVLKVAALKLKKKLPRKLPRKISASVILRDSR